MSQMYMLAYDIIYPILSSNFLTNQAMTGTLGGGIDDAMDWLCLHVEHHTLPRAFTDKSYVVYANNLQLIRNEPNASTTSGLDESRTTVPAIPLDTIHEHNETAKLSNEVAIKEQEQIKSWTLRYAQELSDDSSGSDDDDPYMSHRSNRLPQSKERAKPVTTEELSLKYDRLKADFALKTKTAASLVGRLKFTML
jgi:hypothetical protein